MTSHCCVWLCDRWLKNFRHRDTGAKVVYFGAFVTIGARRFCPEYGSERGQVGVVNLFFFYRYLCGLFFGAIFQPRRCSRGTSAAGLVVTFA